MKGGTAESVAAFRSSQTPLRRYCGFNVDILKRPPVRLWRQTTGTVNTAQLSQPVVNNHRPLCWRHLWVEREASLQLMLAIFLCLLLKFYRRSYILSKTNLIWSDRCATVRLELSRTIHPETDWHVSTVNDRLDAQEDSCDIPVNDCSAHVYLLSVRTTGCSWNDLLHQLFRELAATQ